MSVSVRTRFEVFKRDRFTCSYCGKHPPEILLECDHIVPRAAGGSDEIDNLTTACVDCNRGKADRMLEEGTAPAVNRSALLEMQERINQAKAYMDLLGSLQQIHEQAAWRVTEAWAKAYGATLTENDDGSISYTLPDYGRWPEEGSVKRFIKKLGLEAVLDAVEITVSRIPDGGSDAVRYFYGVCHTAIREGRAPLSPQQPTTDRFDEGMQLGITVELARIGELLANYQENGFATLEDAVTALWPSD